MLKAVTLSTLAGSALAAPELESAWSQFKVDYKRNYASQEEEQQRKQVFARTLVRIDELNAADPHAIHGVNQFADLSPAEFKAQYLTYKPSRDEALRKAPLANPNKRIAVNSTCTDEKCDWVSQGAVGKVRNQGQCGSCWAFSTAEQVASDNFLAGNKLEVLSVQQIVDCEKKDQGCNGGDPVNAYPYIVSVGGLETELSYPYLGVNSKCRFKASKVSQTLAGFHNVVPPCLGAFNNCKDNEKGLANATAYVKNSGPVSICVNAGPWQTYMGGVMSTGCSPAHAELDHCVQLTGYGTKDGVDYWAVRNSWGPSWGLEGYIHIAQKNNICGILDEMTVADIGANSTLLA